WRPEPGWCGNGTAAPMRWRCWRKASCSGAGASARSPPSPARSPAPAGRARGSSAWRPEMPRVRCAIYTRKSSEEGLEQDFNSLDAQREACAAFIASQRREGWLALGEMYDDGGFSGATMERPAFQQLL